MAAWDIPFPSLGDPEVSIAEELRRRGLLDVIVDKELAEFFNKAADLGSLGIAGSVTGGKYEVGVMQPAILA